MNRTIILGVVTIIAIIAGVWFTNVVLTVDDQDRWLFFGVFIAIALLFTPLPGKPPIDLKLVIIVIIGYLFSGKAFAYVSPVKPIYISEICLALLGVRLIYLVLNKGAKIFLQTKFHTLLLCSFLYASFLVPDAYFGYRIDALKDYAMFYYVFYFFILFQIFLNPKNVESFSKYAWPFALAAFSALLGSYFLTYMLNSFPVTQIFYLPHKDAWVGVVSGFFYYLIFGNKKIWLMALGAFVGLAGALVGSSSIVLCIAIVSGVGALATRKMNKFLPLAMVGVLTIGIVAFLYMYNVKFVVDRFDAVSDDLGTSASTVAGSDMGGNTVQWRMDWASQITEDVMKTSPLFGLGLGNPQVSAYILEQYPTITDEEANAIVRYPHNVFFTILGRIGIIGLFFWVPIWILTFKYCYRFAKICLHGDENLLINCLAFGAVLGGLTNSFMQMTYEAPYGAIPFWVFLAFVVSKVELHKASLRGVRLAG